MAKKNLRNLQCKSLAGSIIGFNTLFEKFLQECSSEQLFNIAIEALDYFSYIGLTENLNQSIIDICRLNGFCPPKHIARLNKSKKLEEIIDAETINIIRENNAADIRLYEYVKVHYQNESIKAYNIDLSLIHI